MLSRENAIAMIITWIGFIEIIIGIIIGIALGSEDVGSYYRSTEHNWTITIIWWVASFIAGMFIIALSEIIEQLHQLNLKHNKSIQSEDDFELLN